MQMLYESDTFVVVHINAYDSHDNPHNEGKPARHGFEIVHKGENREMYLDGEWAAAFQAQINEWQAETPEQEDVEAVLTLYTKLAHYPLCMH